MTGSVRSTIAAYFRLVATYQAEALLAAAYWTVVALSAVALRLLRRRLLPDTFGSGRSHWIERPADRRGPDPLTRQY